MSFLLGLGSLAGQLPQGMMEGQYIAQQRQNNQALGSLGDALSSMYGGGSGGSGQQQSQQGGGLFGMGNLFGNAKQQYNDAGQQASEAPQTASMVPAMDIPQTPQGRQGLSPQDQQRFGQMTALAPAPAQTVTMQQPQQPQQQGGGFNLPFGLGDLFGGAKQQYNALAQPAVPRVAQPGVAPPGQQRPQQPGPDDASIMARQRGMGPEDQPQPQQGGVERGQQGEPLGNGFMSLKDLVGSIKRANPNISGQQMARAVLAGLPILHQEGLAQYQELRGLIQQERIGQGYDRLSQQQGQFEERQRGIETRAQQRETRMRQQVEFATEKSAIDREYTTKYRSIMNDSSMDEEEKQKKLADLDADYEKKTTDLEKRMKKAESEAAAADSGGDSGGGQADQGYAADGSLMRYKGTGDRNDKANWEVVK